MNFSIILVAAIILCGTNEASAITREQCNHEFNKCKKDIKNLLNQNKCKKSRSKCESQADADSQQASTKAKMLGGFQENDVKGKMLGGGTQDNGMKGQMLGGSAGSQNPNGMNDWHGKAAAQQRLLEREQNGGSAKNKMMAGGQEPALDPKEAARLRMLERQKAQGN